MSYASRDDMLDRCSEAMLIDLTDRADPPTGEIGETVLARGLADADAVIDGYLKGRYLLPLSATPPLVRDLALAITTYKLHRNAASDKVRQDYEDAISALKQIASGVVRLDVAGVEPASSGTSGVRTTDRARDMTPDNLKGFV